MLIKIEILKTIWTSLGKEERIRTTDRDGNVVTRWHVVHHPSDRPRFQ